MAGWEVRTLFSDSATFITKGFVLLSGKSLSTRMETGSALVGSGVEMECNPRTSQWGCSFPAAAFCSHTTNTLIDVDVVLKRSTFLFDAGKQLHTPSL